MRSLSSFFSLLLVACPTYVMGLGCTSTGDGEAPAREANQPVSAVETNDPVAGDLTVTKGELQSVVCDKNATGNPLAYGLVRLCVGETCSAPGITTEPGNREPWNKKDTRSTRDKKLDLLNACYQQAARENSGKARVNQLARCEIEMVYLGCTPLFNPDTEGKKQREKFTNQASWFGKKPVDFPFTDSKIPLQGSDVVAVQSECASSAKAIFPYPYAKTIALVGARENQKATIFFTSAAEAQKLLSPPGAVANTLLPSVTNTDVNSSTKPPVHFGKVLDTNNAGLATAADVSDECALLATTYNRGKKPQKQTARCLATEYIRDYCFSTVDNTERWRLPSD